MIKKFSKYLSDYFIKIGIVERKNKSWCQYVIEKKAIRLIFGMATLIFSLYIKKTLEIALFLIIFCSIRKHIGGWHASSPWKCLTLSSVMLLLITVFLEPSVERLPPIITLILNAVLFADILRCSPLYPQCVHFGENEKNANNQKKKVVIYTILFFNIIFFEALIQKISTVVLLPLESNYNLTVLRPKLKRIKELAVEYGKEILDFTEENPKLFPLCPNPEGTSIKDIKQAVVSIGGMLDASRTFELFMAAFSALKKKKVKVSAFSSYFPSEIIGVHYIGTKKQIESIPSEQYIKSLNSYIFTTAIQEMADVVLIDLPDGFIPYNHLSTADFGVCAYKIMQAIPPDCLILSTSIDCMDIDFTKRMNSLFEYRFGKRPSKIVFENSIVNYLDVGRGGGMKKLIIPPKDIQKYAPKCVDNSLFISDTDIEAQIYSLIMNELGA